MTVNSVAPGTLPPEKAAGVVVPPVTTGVEVVAVGAVTVTTFEALVALKPTVAQAPVVPRVQALILAAISVATAVVVPPVALAERIWTPSTVMPVTVPAAPTVMVAVR